MKHLMLHLLAPLLLISGFSSQAQLSVGASSLFIAGTTDFITDSLIIVPSSNLTITSTNIVKTNTPVEGASGSSIARVYDISQPVPFTGTLGFIYLDGEMNGNTEASLAFAWKDGNGNYTTSTNSTLNTSTNVILQTMSGVGTIQATAVNLGISLPVSLTGYTVKAENGRTKIEWITGFEQSNNRFEVERSVNRTDFSTIAVVPGANMATGHSYVAYDNNPVEGVNYYRLVQYDNDGKKKYYAVKAVTFNSSNQISAVVYPNPTTQLLSISLQNYTGKNIEVNLFDLRGVLIHKEAIKVNAGQTVYPVNLKMMPSSGDYILKINGSNGFSRNIKVSIL